MSRTSIRWVIKFGGSLCRSATLGAWLESLAEHSCLIVPGGGPFADAVRELQKQQGFSDAVAHGLAIRAMALYGQTLLGMEPRLRPIEALHDGALGHQTSAPRVWLPDPEDPVLQGLEASWNVTSDSIAAQLALELKLPQLLLIKSLTPPKGPMRLQSATDQGLIDPAFEKIIRGKPLKVWLIGPNPRGLAKGLQDPVSSFTQLIV